MCTWYVGILRELRGQRVEPDGAGAGLLHAVVFNTGVAGDFNIDRAVDEVGIAAEADVPLDESDASVGSTLKLTRG